MTHVKTVSGKSLVALATCRCGKKKDDDFDLLCPTCGGNGSGSQVGQKSRPVFAIPVDDSDLPPESECLPVIF
jgi:hypothetical protein